MVADRFYHLFNRGNNRVTIFYRRSNYIFFKNKVISHFLPHLHILAYCLMPNHFHFLIYCRHDFKQASFSNDLAALLRSYSRAINNQEGRTGSLFQQNTKIKSLEGNLKNDLKPNSGIYPFICFHYIHQNPLKAGLVTDMREWTMSSYSSYLHSGKDRFLSKEIAYDLLDIPRNKNEFIRQSKEVIIDNIDW